MKNEYIFWNKHDNSLCKVESMCNVSGGMILKGGKFGSHSMNIKDGILMVYYERFDDNFKALEAKIKKK